MKNQEFSWYDRDKEPMDQPAHFWFSGSHAVAELPDVPGEDIIGIFTEDDGNLFLQHTFSKHWAPTLASNLRRAVRHRH